MVTNNKLSRKVKRNMLRSEVGNRGMSNNWNSFNTAIVSEEALTRYGSEKLGKTSILSRFADKFGRRKKNKKGSK